MYRDYDFYRRKTTRLQKWEYSWKGYYFVTINTKNGEHFFGEVKNSLIYLSKIGKIAQEEWLNIPAIRPDMNISLGEFVIMPNHMHGIIKIGKNRYNSSDAMHRIGTIEASKESPMHRVGTIKTHHQGIPNGKSQHKFGPQKKEFIINY